MQAHLSVNHLCEKSLGYGDVRLWRVPAGRGGRPHDLGPQRPQRRHLLVGHLLRHHNDTPTTQGISCIPWTIEQSRSGVYISILKQYLFLLLSENDIPPPSHYDTLFFDSFCALFAYLFPILHLFYSFTSHFLFFFPPFLPFFLFLLHFPHFSSPFHIFSSK
jgi:hypothetical protein